MPGRLRPVMESDRPRLLVALRPTDEIRDALNAAFPQVPWAFLDRASPDRWGDVEAMLVGSLDRQYASFDAASTPRLRFVQRIYTGLDVFPFGRFPVEVEVAGNVGGFAPFVAEHAMALALAAARDLHTAGEMVAAGRLRPPPHARTLHGATAVILGYGAIGREIGRRLASFDCRVVAVTRTGAPADGAETALSADRLLEAVGLGPFVFEARPLTQRTAGTIDAAALGRMRPDAVFVNVGRAGTVVEADLFHHLEGHPEFRAAFDVWWHEDYEKGTLASPFPFARLPNFYGTPHSAGALEGAGAYALRTATENLARFFRGERPSYLADRAEYRT
jgi:phosphoglycerate dehydrogenase-like enzyme